MYLIFRSLGPIYFATLASISMSGSGKINLHIEGSMMLCALIADIVFYKSSSYMLAISVSFMAALAVNLLYLFLAKKNKKLSISISFAINLILIGLSDYLLFLCSGDRGMAGSFQNELTPAFHGIDFFFVLSILSGVFLSIFYKSKYGVRARAQGFDEKSALFRGVNLKRYEFVAVVLSAFFTALSGASLCLSYFSYYSRNLSQGRGYLALAFDGMSSSNPIKALIISFLYLSLSYIMKLMEMKNIIEFNISQFFPYFTAIIIFFIFGAVKNIKKNIYRK